MTKWRISPNVCAYSDEKNENLKIEIQLPGVKKEDITFKVNEDSFYIKAPKEDVEYIGSYAVCCPIIPDKADAKYKDGLLNVTVPYKEPFEEAVNVKIK